MNNLIEPEMKQLHDNVLLMGGEVERAIERAMQALTSNDSQLAKQVLADDDRIDALELESDQLGIRILALKSPEAHDLRFVISSSKIIGLLERIADHACNIARVAINADRQPPSNLHLDLPRMAQIASEMLHGALGAYANSDAVAAQTIIERDDEIDLIYHRLFQELLDLVSQDSTLATSATGFVLVAKNLERIGDYATDICERIVFMKEGRVIKHHRPVKE